MGFLMYLLTHACCCAQVSFLAFALLYRMLGSYIYDLALEPDVSVSLCCATGFDSACSRCWAQTLADTWLTAETAGLLVYLALPVLTIRQKLAGENPMCCLLAACKAMTKAIWAGAVLLSCTWWL